MQLNIGAQLKHSALVFLSSFFTILLLCNSFVHVISVVTSRSQGYALLPQVPTLTHHEQGSDSPVETSTSGQAQQHQSPLASGYPNFMFPQVPNGTFIFCKCLILILFIDRLGADLNVTGSQLEAQERFLRHQIEVKALHTLPTLYCIFIMFIYD